ncbi:MAG: hypothetical protein K9J16_01975 [Melioribacteraceae bacterium]|nr:hypothetical protein [Melioribacteraceae bacterium]MCF8353034.1 hypothetical protein [Melioribacteraceae bacterium]MCF8392925.1 hypothetical protein [Melioribacteraceae bacterium]MCF8417780.1 hypothetical protein [Melioribacteraceae bacterium]
MESVLENKLMILYKEEMISFLKSHPEHFDEAIQLAISDKQPFAWRAAFLLVGSIEENDNRIQKHIKSIVNCIQEKEDGHQRELLKILDKVNISEKYEGQVFNICMNLWEQINKQPSVRITAFKFIVKIAKRHPELSKEINFLTQDHYLESLSPGVKRSIEKIIQELDQQRA